MKSKQNLNVASVTEPEFVQFVHCPAAPIPRLSEAVDDMTTGASSGGTAVFPAGRRPCEHARAS